MSPSALAVLDEARAKIATGDVEVVIHVAPLLEQLQRVMRMPGLATGKFDGPSADFDA